MKKTTIILILAAPAIIIMSTKIPVIASVPVIGMLVYWIFRNTRTTKKKHSHHGGIF